MKTYNFMINDDKYKARVLEYKDNNIRVEVNGVEYCVEIESEKSQAIPRLIRSEKLKSSVSLTSLQKTKSVSAASGVKAPIPGLIQAILVKEGERVNEGDPVLILEAMKMESEITTDISGVIKKILIKEGDTVLEGDLLMEIGE
jgi:glutaconyl-CoA/methylmalonyl-CoA decarboxylase subunit gamma